MNRPCRIHFYADAAPSISRLPDRYKVNAEILDESGQDSDAVASIMVQNAFPIDFAPEIIRTRVGGKKEEDPVDFPLSSISFIEWFYGADVPNELEPYVRRSRNEAG